MNWKGRRCREKDEMIYVLEGAKSTKGKEGNQGNQLI
jgi:hypothetical protein